MAEQSEGIDGQGNAPLCIPAALVEYVLLGPADDRRVLQDSPVLGDVWLAYAKQPGSVQDLLITPHRQETAAAVAAEIARQLKQTEAGSGRRARLAYLQGIVAVRLHFGEVLRILVPITQWWRKRGGTRQVKEARETLHQPGELEKRLAWAFSLEAFLRARAGVSRAEPGLTAFDRYLALVGLILWAERTGSVPSPGPEDVLRLIGPDEVATMAAHLRALYGELARKEDTSRPEAADPDNDDSDAGLIYQISLNRRPMTALDRSVPAVKADAARTLFSIQCDKIVWAVLDAGIDGCHPAFRLPDGDKKARRTRIRRTFDFTRIRDILSVDNASIGEDELKQMLSGTAIGRNEARRRLRAIARDAEDKRPVNWDRVEELITLSRPPEPPSPHGTHVAGIIGADGRNADKDRMGPDGMCPDIRLYDFRVLGKSDADTEFAVIAALQYIRYINERHSNITIHGANLSLSIPHNVRNYACGRTPVCVECERLVESGVVVVAAAGNRGYQSFETKDGAFESYAAFSITDPGNSDGVITVGATHGNWPHTYGVSFFSSRGPTGDGRQKPDLVAPGERILSTVKNHEWDVESGTSMAAPHVSGAAAMLLARYPELVGRPREVKRILCETATDLGRERSFQGHGMLDVLRAFQSI